MYDIVYQILKPYIRFVLTVVPLDEKIVVDLIYCNLSSAQMKILPASDVLVLITY